MTSTAAEGSESLRSVSHAAGGGGDPAGALGSFAFGAFAARGGPIGQRQQLVQGGGSGQYVVVLINATGAIAGTAGHAKCICRQCRRQSEERQGHLGCPTSGHKGLRWAGRPPLQAAGQPGSGQSPWAGRSGGHSRPAATLLLASLALWAPAEVPAPTKVRRDTHMLLQQGKSCQLLLGVDWRLTQAAAALLTSVACHKNAVLMGQAVPPLLHAAGPLFAWSHFTDA